MSARRVIDEAKVYFTAAMQGVLTDEQRAEWMRALQTISDLISQQDDLAKALLAVEWSGHDRDGSPECPACEAGMFFPAGDTRNEHRKDCALDAALRKAGLRG